MKRRRPGTEEDQWQILLREANRKDVIPECLPAEIRFSYGFRFNQRGVIDLASMVPPGELHEYVFQNISDRLSIKQFAKTDPIFSNTFKKDRVHSRPSVKEIAQDVVIKNVDDRTLGTIYSFLGEAYTILSTMYIPKSYYGGNHLKLVITMKHTYLSELVKLNKLLQTIPHRGEYDIATCVKDGLLCLNLDFSLP